jgi:outer membrane protein OmpU
MNKLTKIGASALCGSLAAISAANAGDLSVKGGANMTYTKLGYGETGNPLGMSSAMTFTGSGELDNGSTVTINIAHNDKSTYSATDIAIATPSMGTFTYDEGGGTGIDRYDDMMPTAWEETDGTGVTAGFVTVSGVGGMTDIEWAMPADMLPDGLSAYISFSPKPDGSANTDKGANSAGSDVDGWGYDIAGSHTGLVDGMNIFGGYSVIPKFSAASGVAQGVTGDETSYVLGFTYAVGGATLGYQESMKNVNSADSGTTAYSNAAYGVSFSVNDDLSLSYGMHKSERGTNTGAGAIEVEAESVQIAYSMGGATLKIAETQIDNSAYVSTTAGDKEGTTMMLSLAF